MANSSAPITPGTGLNVDGFTAPDGDFRQAMVVGDPSTASAMAVDTAGRASVLAAITNPSLAALGIYAGLSGYGAQRVTTEPSVLFNDSFDSASFDPIKWATTGSTVVPTSANGDAIIAPGAAASAATALSSVPSFTPPGGTFLGLGMLNRFENVAGAAGAAGYLNSHRFFGIAQAPTTWSATYSGSGTTGPILNGWGFEIDTDGYAYAVVYDTGVRTRADAVGQATGEKRLNLGRSLFNGELHQFTLVMRADAIFWYIDGQDQPAAVYNYRSAGFPLPDVQTLPIRLHTINSATAPSGTIVHRPAALALADTGHNTLQLADPTYGWRRATVDGTGNLSVNLGGSGGLTQVAGTISAAGANTPGTASTASTTGQVVSNVAAAGNVTFHLVSIAFVGTLIWEASVDGGLNYSPIMAVREDGTGSETGAALNVAAAFIRQYTVGIPGMTWFRVRASAYTSGTVAVVIAPGPFLIEPTPSLGASTATIGTVLERSSDLAVSATAAISTGVTATLPAAGAGLFHYITGIEIQRYAGAALTGVATPVLVTSTNLPGSLTWSVDTAAAIGTSQVQLISFAGNPLKSSAANTATTIVAPIFTSAIWRINVTYFTGI